MKYLLQDIRLIALLTTVGIAIIVLSLFFGSAPIMAGDTFAAFFASGDARVSIIVNEISLPRSLAAWFTGFALGASGAALQGLLRNPLSDPGVLGVSASGALGATIAIYFNFVALGFWVLPVFAILGALMATLALALFSMRNVSTTRLILVGIGISSFAGALISLVMNLAPTPFALADLVNWLFGTVSNRSMNDLGLALPFMLIGLIILLPTARYLSALTLGEETATTLGVDIRKTQLSIIVGTALLTGASVALAGTIGFVGIVAPHLARPWVHHDPARLILPSALLAAAMLTASDLIIRILPFNQELRLGVVAALIGAPAFAIIAARHANLGDS